MCRTQERPRRRQGRGRGRPPGVRDHGRGDRTRAINVDGSRNVFEAAVEAGAERICYASSVAAYGFHADNPDWLTEDVARARHRRALLLAAEGRGRGRSSQHAAQDVKTSAGCSARASSPARGRRTCSRRSPTSGSPSGARPRDRALSSMPILKPVIPDTGARFQFVHEDDVASAFLLGVRGQGEPGPYNLAGPGSVTMSDWPPSSAGTRYRCPSGRSEPRPRSWAAAVAPESISWIHAVRRPVLMKTDRARESLPGSPSTPPSPRSSRWWRRGGPKRRP